MIHGLDKKHSRPAGVPPWGYFQPARRLAVLLKSFSGLLVCTSEFWLSNSICLRNDKIIIGVLHLVQLIPGSCKLHCLRSCELFLECVLKRVSRLAGEIIIPLILRYFRMSGRQKPLTKQVLSVNGLARESGYPQLARFFW
jgi:hypothetical protein